MTISPHNLLTMVKATVALFGGDSSIGPSDAYIMKLIALYMLNDEDALEVFEQHLRPYDARVMALWRGWFSHVRAENLVEFLSSEKDAMDFFRRIVNEQDGGEGTRGQSK